MKILVLEGIPTSGKSSVTKEISELLGEDHVRVYGETETHIPIMEKLEEPHIEFFKSLLQDATESDANLVIFDRFYFTQAFRAKASIDVYAEVEDLLAKQKTLVVYLHVDDSTIADRIRLAAEHRDKKRIENFQWGEYFQSKGDTFDEIAEHYATQQRSKIALINQSKLKGRIFDTTHHEYKAIASQIISEWFNQSDNQIVHSLG